MYQRMPLLGWGEMDFYFFINEEFEYFEEDVIREGSHCCHLLVKWAYTTQSQ